jgi:hypothetical protein
MLLVPGKLSGWAVSRFKGNTVNVALVTVTAAGVVIVDLDCGTVAVGDIILVGMECTMTKGAVAGNSTFQIMQTGGTGLAVFAAGGLCDWRRNAVPAFDVWLEYKLARLDVLTSGTMRVGYSGVSAGSDSNVGVNNGKLVVEVLAPA